MKISVTEPWGDYSYRVLADFAMSHVTEGEAMVNAQLFAAAQDLLSAAKLAVEELDATPGLTPSPAQRALEAAIKRAEDV